LLRRPCDRRRLGQDGGAGGDDADGRGISRIGRLPFRPTPDPPRVSSDENEAVVSFGALHRGTLTPLLEHGIHCFRFDG
jgi:hypothetical protein